MLDQGDIKETYKRDLYTNMKPIKETQVFTNTKVSDQVRDTREGDIKDTYKRDL